MKNSLPLSLEMIKKDRRLQDAADRLLELALASRLDLADEHGWEALADQCEESGEPDGVIHLALVTAWRSILHRLHGLVEEKGGCVGKALGCLKRAPSSQSMLRHMEGVRKAISIAQKTRYPSSVVSPLLLRATSATLDRAQALHDRLKARGLLREK